MLNEFLATHNFNIIQFLLVAIGYLAPIPLAMIAIHLWLHYRQHLFASGIKWTVLEILVPRDVVKTPAAMELILTNALYHQSNKGFWEKYFIGAPWLWFSLEMVSIDGKVHFYIRTPSRIRDLVETQIYAQYPQAKVVEVDDYAFHIPQYKKNGDWYVWGTDFKKAKEDFFPIKTYKDFGTDMATGVKEEFKVDPITPVIEYLGSIPKGQQIWIQIVIRQNIIKYLSNEGEKVNFYEKAVERIKETSVLPSGSPLPPYISDYPKKMMEQLSKLHFDTGIRLIALSDKRNTTEDQFNNLRRDVRLLFRQYAHPYSNELVRCNSTVFETPWADPTGLALQKYKKRSLDFYRMRTFFDPPIQYSFSYPTLLSAFFPSGSPNIFVMSTEELATIFHFPGMVSETPSFKRIESKIAKPPSNLPI